jgi:hypothetical protein
LLVEVDEIDIALERTHHRERLLGRREGLLPRKVVMRVVLVQRHVRHERDAGGAQHEPPTYE